MKNTLTKNTTKTWGVPGRGLDDDQGYTPARNDEDTVRHVRRQLSTFRCERAWRPPHADIRRQDSTQRRAGNRRRSVIGEWRRAMREGALRTGDSGRVVSPTLQQQSGLESDAKAFRVQTFILHGYTTLKYFYNTVSIKIPVFSD
jgi:hypothetical protein